MWFLTKHGILQRTHYKNPHLPPAGLVTGSSEHGAIHGFGLLRLGRCKVPEYAIEWVQLENIMGSMT